MALEKIERLRREIEENANLSSTHKQRLLVLLESLGGEIENLGDDKAEHAKSIAGFTELSAHEATRTEKKPELLQTSLKALDSSVEEFEASHPALVDIVNRISVMLADIGI